MKNITQAVANGCGVDAEPSRRAAMYIKKDGAFLEFATHRLRQALAHGLEERMPRRNPLGCGRTLKDLFVKNKLLVFTAESAESWLKLLANRPQMARHTWRAV